MKSIKIIALLLSVITMFQACKDDTAQPVPVPSITATGALSGIPGATVQIKASINYVDSPIMIRLIYDFILINHLPFISF